MSDDREYIEGLSRMARELAHSGKCNDIMDIEAAIIMKGYAVGFLQEPVLRAELELLIDDAHRKAEARSSHRA